ncbi:MAF protein [Litorivivens lipolytica]|uniref:7-methyl-GTP pyrophosphatase n=1 Tax=Litorivivens lipolytica TaxID=1524264 RepID=A0A7W4Z4X6_9GAMM|nr:nucleoside triphosphate pyrophosphatase [Litorivivens lipolytica]MBB3046547.1 MAF protein [Litorivivens lipolytica]
MPSATTPEIVLASGSSYRAELLHRLGISFARHSPDIDESAKPGEKPQDLALRLAEEKAAAIARQHPKALVIGSDQVASLDGKPLGKPGTAERACEQLAACSGKTVSFYTGLCLTGPDGTDSLVDLYTVTFRTLSTEQIQRYVEKELPLDCAGSFKMEGLGISLFEKTEGNDPNTLIGLPLIELTTLLNKRGVTIP